MTVSLKFCGSRSLWNFPKIYNCLEIVGWAIAHFSLSLFSNEWLNIFTFGRSFQKSDCSFGRSFQKSDRSFGRSIQKSNCSFNRATKRAIAQSLIWKEQFNDYSFGRSFQKNDRSFDCSFEKNNWAITFLVSQLKEQSLDRSFEKNKWANFSF